MAEATTEPVGRYVQIAVDTPDNVQSFALVKETSTSNFNAINPSVKTHSGTGCKIIQIVPNYTSSQPISNEDREYLSGLGYVRHQQAQYSIVTDGSTYRTMMTANESGLATNRNFEPVEVGVKPIDFDENKTWKYYTKRECNDPSIYPELFYYRNVRADTAWNSETQYYQNTTDFHHYYVIDGEKKVRFGIGDLGLYYNKNMSQPILSTNDDDNNGGSRHSAFWTFINGDTTTGLWTGTGTSYYNVDIGNSVVPAVQNLFSGMSRYLFDSDTYNSHWKTGVTDEQKGQWRTSVHNNLVIKNVTLTQFGFVNHDGHRYFGVWAFYPEAKYYVGYQQYPTTGTDTNKKGTGPYTAQTVESDLRTYDFSKPIPDTETPRLRYFQFYGVELDALEVTLKEKEGTKPPDINPNPTPSAGWTPLKPLLPTQRNLGVLAGANQHGFHVWCLAKEQFQGLVGSLWQWGNFSESYDEQMNKEGGIYNPLTNPEGTGSFNAALQNWFAKGKIDPLSAVQTCMALPSFVTPQVLGENDFGKVKIAGIELSWFGHCCQHDTYVADFTIKCDNTAVTDSYLDVAPNTSAEIYLPYIGTVGLDPASFIGGSITVRYSCCVVDGTISATVVCTSSMAEANITQYGPYLGSASYRIPIAQKDANAFQRELGYVKAVGTAVTGVVGAAFGASKHIAGTLAHTMLDTAGALEQSVLTPQIMHGGELGSGSAIVCPTDYIQVQLSTPLPKHLDEADLKQYGTSSGEIGTIESFGNGSSGRYVSYSYAKLDSIPATRAEIEEIKAILYGGVYQ